MLVRIKTFANGATQGRVVDCGTHELATKEFDDPQLAGCISAYLPINSGKATFARVGDTYYRVKRCSAGYDEVTVFYEDAKPYIAQAEQTQKLTTVFAKHAVVMYPDTHMKKNVLTLDEFLAAAKELSEALK